MARKQVKQVPDAELLNDDGEKVVFFKATMPLNEEEHAGLAEKIRQEQEHSGLKIVLVPYSVDLIIANAPAAEAGEPHAGDDPSVGDPPAGDGQAAAEGDE
ncbi:hypothetical protein [Paenibacillus sp. MMS18-CY102]|uniref:hypothetical protein n=1 Tax=Paenibacillus sp. MMS18-CY102 TaxID=2682849 RepID=UPI001921FDF0|nr:hypothetical protein [Paenibacillus sp. MMS18-CY102]